MAALEGPAARALLLAPIRLVHRTESVAVGPVSIARGETLRCAAVAPCNGDDIHVERHYAEPALPLAGGNKHPAPAGSSSPRPDGNRELGARSSMTNFVEQVEGAILATAFHARNGYSWFGIPCPQITPRARQALGERAIHKWLFSQLRWQLYRAFYCQGVAAAAEVATGV